MVWVIERRGDAKGGEKILVLSVQRHPQRPGEIVGTWCLAEFSDHGSVSQSAAADVSIGKAFLDAIACCEENDIPTLWVRDPEGLFPPEARPTRDINEP